MKKFCFPTVVITYNFENYNYIDNKHKIVKYDRPNAQQTEIKIFLKKVIIISSCFIN